MKSKGLFRSLLLLLGALVVLSACAAPAVPTQAPIPTQAPTFTSTPTTALAQEEPASAPTAAPTPDEARLADADAALQFGDYSAALEAYARAKSSGSAAQRAAGLYGQGLTYFKL